jgi:hypothetical protein
VIMDRGPLCVFSRAVLLTSLLLLAAGIAFAQQVPDPNYAPPIHAPAYESGKGPLVLIDEAHNNFHTADGRYKPFADLLRRDGYRVEGLARRLAPDSLTGADVLVIANALNVKNLEDWSLPTPSAFTREEINAVRDWVAGGGSLFLIADHMPFAGAAADLAEAFGAAFSNGYAALGNHVDGQMGDVFERPTGLQDTPITRGRTEDETVTRIVTFTGSAFRPPADAVPVLVLSPGSISHETERAPGITPEAPKVAIDGWCQGAVMKVGKGRVAIFGEAAMFSAQLAGPQQRPVGMNSPEAPQNYQLLLNVMHWLSRANGMPD